MRINEHKPALPVEPKRAAVAHRGESRGEGVAGPDKVSLSGEVQRLRQARAERLAELKATIDAGTYDVDLDQLAEAIVGREGK